MFMTATHKLFSIASTSFDNKNLGTQIRTNYNSITQNYFLSTTFQSRPTKDLTTENKQQFASLPISQTRFPLTNVIKMLKSLAFPQMLNRRNNIELYHTNICK
ncbi:unnamed protein product [Penicillium salamii]|nr:unnamed protein product [Penicillium salamii]